MRLYKRGDVWHVSYFDAQGKRVRKSTKYTDRRAAEEFGARCERASAAPDRAAQEAETLAIAFERLLDERRARAQVGEGSIATVGFYIEKSGHWLRIFGPGYPLAQLSAENVDRYVLQRRGEGATKATVAKELVALRAAMRLSVRAKAYAGDPRAILPVGYSPGYVPRARWLTHDELLELLGRLTGDRAARVAYMVALGAELGATDRAERKDVGKDSVLVRGTKRPTRWRRVPIVTEFQRELLKFALDHAEGEAPLLFRPWGKVQRDLARACRRVGCVRTGCPSATRGNWQCGREDCEKAAMPVCTPNDLRRTCATWFALQGVGDELIGKFLGHKSPAMARLVYAKLDEQGLANRLRAAIGCDAGVSQEMSKDAVNRKSGGAEVKNPAENSGPSGTRTLDQRIKSPLHLPSHADDSVRIELTYQVSNEPTGSICDAFVPTETMKKRWARDPAPGYIYFVRAVHSRCVKIGKSTDPQGRLENMMCDSPEPLQIEVLLKVDHIDKAEVSLHYRFSADRMHGEWFKPSPELEEFIQRLLRSAEGVKSSQLTARKMVRPATLKENAGRHSNRVLKTCRKSAGRKQ